MAETHSPYSKQVIAAKVIALPSLIGFVEPVFHCIGLMPASEFHTPVKLLVSAVIVLSVESSSIWCVKKLNHKEIESKKFKTSQQISELQDCLIEELDTPTIKNVEKEIRRLKKELTSLIAK